MTYYPPGSGVPYPPRGPKVRADIFDLYLLRPRDGSFDVLQLRRAEEPLAGTWQPVMGHVEAGESTLVALAREAAEELDLNLADEESCPDLFALEQVHPFFLPELDAIVFSPRFVVVVQRGHVLSFDQEHDAHRWLPLESAAPAFMWPGQRAAIAEIKAVLDPSQHATLSALRIDRSKLV